MDILELVKKILKNNPRLIRCASPIYNYLIGFNKRKINGSNNKLQGYSFLKNVNIVIIGNNNIIDFGYVCRLNECEIYIHGNDNQITLGKTCFLKNAGFWIEDDNNIIKIGDSTSTHGTTHFAATEGKKIIIGCDCMFAADVTIRTGDSHTIFKMNSKDVINHGSDVIIGNHVWLGNKATLLKGSSVADNSIVGTGAIVTKKYGQNNVVLAGNPARIIKEEIDWVRERYV
jgi:acetyltransferase-like isoleucine patch superfamily enzyme